MIMLRVSPTILLAFVLGGCAVGPNYARPSVPRPAQFKSPPPASNAASIPTAWWELYADSQLTALIARADKANQTLAQAVGRVDEARALSRVAAADLYPSVALGPSAGVQRLSGNRASQVTGTPVQSGATISDWLLPLDLSYEVDVWGRVRRSLEAAKAQAAASIDDAAALRLAVQTDVAQDYFGLRLLDSQLEILGRSVAAYEEQVRLLGVQVETGLASEISLNQAQAQLQSTLAQQSDVARARADEEHALAILCGEAAPGFSLASQPLGDATPPAVPPGLPASILTRRPDVAEAEQNLVAANAQVGVARADLYPRLNLTASAGVDSSAISSLFEWQSRVASLVAGITAPLFEGGRLRANLDAVRARHRQAVAAYVAQVLVAYGDVEDALTDLNAQTAQVAHLREAVRASENYRRLADVQYNNGLVDYLIVIDAERTLLSNQLALAQASSMQLSASIHLIKALGGGWQIPTRVEAG
jgi:multidrug efflux system outer membrane protein